MSWSPSIFLGYNSIRFDEEMLRNAFFQTLQPPYLTSLHANGRADVWGLMMAVAALHPEYLKIPTDQNGSPIFQLEKLANANRIAQSKAHDAISDVLATLELCRLVFRTATEVWQRFVRFSRKTAVADFVEGEDSFVLTEFFANQAYHSPVVCIGIDPEQPNGRLCLNLGNDIELLAGFGEADLRNELAQKPCPIRRFRINAAPTLTPIYDASKRMLSDVDTDRLEESGRRVKEDPNFCQRLMSSYASLHESKAPSQFIEERIYDGFPGQQDESHIEAFHSVDWPNRIRIVQSFEDERLREFGSRLLYFEARSILPDAFKIDIEQRLINRLLGKNTGALSLVEAQAELNKLLRIIPSEPNHVHILEGYRTYLADRLFRVEQYRAKIR